MSLSNTISNTNNSNGRGRQKVTIGTVQPNKKLHNKLKSHSRSYSHNKVLNKLSTSSTPMVPNMGARPNLNRSKSTDGLVRPSNRQGALKKNSRSFTKLTSLQPLTKTMLNQSLKSNKSTGSLKALNLTVQGGGGGLKTSGRKGKAILRLNDYDNDNNDYEDMENDSEGERNTVNKEARDIISEDTIDEGEQNASKLEEKESEKKVNVDTENGEGGEENEKFLQSRNFKTNYDSSIRGSNTEPDLPLNNSISRLPSVQDSSEDLTAASNLYGGSLLLSQSTGLTKKINRGDNQGIIQRLGVNSNSASPISANKASDMHESSMGSTNSESVSGISFKANPIENTNKYQNQNSVAEPVTTNKNVIQDNSYQPNQTIFNNLQKNNSQNHSKTSNQNSTNSNSVGNDQMLQSYLQQPQQSQHNIETRTQQRLWLQRENSLMDVVNGDANRSNFSSLSLNNMMFAHNYNQSQQNVRDLSQVATHPNGPVTPNEIPNIEAMHSNNAAQFGSDNSNSISNINGLLTLVQNGHQNSIQSRTEFERLNREYLNVRRNLNPIGESLNRVEEIMNKNKDIKITKKKDHRKTLSTASVSTTMTSANTFKEFSPLYHEKEQETNNTLNRLWQEALILTLPLSLSSNSIRVNPPQPSQQPIQTQMQRNNQRVPSYGQSPYNSLRSPQTPTTRAVKLAAQAQAAHAANAKRFNE